MAKFIEVTAFDGTKRLINLAWVEEIWDRGGSVDIYLAFSCPHAAEQDRLRVRDSYEEIKRKVVTEDGT